MKRLRFQSFLFLFPITFVLLFIEFSQPGSSAAIRLEAGKQWVSHLLNGFSSEQYSALSQPTDKSKYLQRGFANQISPDQVNSSLFTSDNLIWQMLFTDQYSTDILVPFRINGQPVETNKLVQANIYKKPFDIPFVRPELTDPIALSMEYEFYEKSITVVKNKQQFIPFRNLESLTFASLQIGQAAYDYFPQYLDKYASFQHFAIPAISLSDNASEALVKKLEKFKVVVISLHGLTNSPLAAYGIPQSSRTLIERLRTKTNVALVVFGTPYSLKYFDRLDYVVCAYEDNSVTQKLVPQILFGAIPASGKLPVTVTASLKAGSGLTTSSLNRLGYTLPERVGLQSSTLQRIDRVVEGCIQDSVMPGAQVLVAKNGKVIFEKAYGYLQYDKRIPVTLHTLFDLASVTKVAATLQAIMVLQSKGVLDIHRKASDYLPELKHTNKENIVIQDLLLHQAGLLAFQDHWTRTKAETGLDSAFYSSVFSPQHPLMVAPGIYGIAALRDSLWQWTIQSRLLKKTKSQKTYPYKYSDVGFDILQQVVERLVNQPLDVYVNQTFYQPLGLDELTFNPLRKFDPNRIAPTELDNRFRGVLLRGTVHDQEAALMGGVAGHAGLFGTANDLAVLMEMNLQKGYYGGKQYFGEQTIPTFTKTYQAGNPRGLGWDRPSVDGGSTAELASPNSFGHTGFTGTCVWIDPDAGIVYIFLSNRVYPDVDNTKLARYKVRQKIQNVIYEAIAPTPGPVIAGIASK
jgi:CubicO group peptidase (beta-lactamase class C family)